MFTTTNVTASAASAGVGGPVTTIVPSAFQILTTQITAPSSTSSSSTSSTTPTTWRITPGSSSSAATATSLIKQPSVVSIVNGNRNIIPTTTTTLPINSTGATLPTTNSTIYYITTASSQQYNTLSNGNILVQSPQTVRLVATPTITCLNKTNIPIINNVRQILTPSTSSSSSSTTTNFKVGMCIDTPTLGRLALAPTIQQQISTNSSLQQIPTVNSSIANQNDTQINSPNSCTVSNDDNSLINDSQDEEIDIFVSNVVCSFSLCRALNLREIAKNGVNVIYKREQNMVLMKIRNPNCTANIWQSGKVTVTGTTSDDDALRAARRIARSVQRLGFKVKFRHYRIVNCLASCAMPWPIDIIKLSKTYPDFISYEPELHPGATVRLEGKAVLKVFTTGSVTLTAPSVERINTAVNEIYPKLFECKKNKS